MRGSWSSCCRKNFWVGRVAPLTKFCLPKRKIQLMCHLRQTACHQRLTTSVLNPPQHRRRFFLSLNCFKISCDISFRKIILQPSREVPLGGIFSFFSRGFLFRSFFSLSFFCAVSILIFRQAFHGLSPFSDGRSPQAHTHSKQDTDISEVLPGRSIPSHRSRQKSTFQTNGHPRRRLPSRRQGRVSAPTSKTRSR